jgi:hypothetical protein
VLSLLLARALREGRVEAEAWGEAEAETEARLRVAEREAAVLGDCSRVAAVEAEGVTVPVAASGGEAVGRGLPVTASGSVVGVTLGDGAAGVPVPSSTGVEETVAVARAAVGLEVAVAG